MHDVTVNFSLGFDQKTFADFVAGRGKAQVEPPGLTLYRLLDEIYDGKPLRIVETGCLRNGSADALMSDGWSTYYFAQWVKRHPGSTLTSIEIDPASCRLCEQFLRSNELGEIVEFLCGDSTTVLLGRDETDFVYLDSCDGLEHGLEEFRTALLLNPKIIVMDDFDTKARMAFDWAAANKIPVERNNRYTIFRPQSGQQ